ncbi:uncharacterized protein BcabD6B2_38040 [Babesia caballi]|uniref:Uncharacterized protein n=1 Tax=Babesia caballi TaxID=5871 RepID=A0AAV4LX57_BABCB|nr:hypothetical protein BcabD6B2_38040 [Babesia caballi]
MEEPSEHDYSFRRALHRIGTGVLCRADLFVVEEFVKRLQDISVDDENGAALVCDTLPEVAHSFNQFMNQRVILPPVPALERRLANLVRKLRRVCRIHSAICPPQKLLRCDKVGLFHLAFVDHAENRADQLAVLKASITEPQFALSPLFARMIAPLIGGITADEFEANFSDILRLLKRGHKGVIFTLFTLQRHMKYDSMMGSATEIVENTKSLLSQQDEAVVVFGAEKLPFDTVRRKGAFSHIVSEVIHWFSKAALRTPDCRIARYLQTTMECFGGTGRSNVSVQEVNSSLLLLLLPDQLHESADSELVRQFINSSRATLKNIARSHPFESVQLNFIYLIGRLLALRADADLEAFLVDLVVEQLKPLDKVTPKSKDAKLNEKILSCVLYSLRFAIGADHTCDQLRPCAKMDQLSRALDSLIRFCHDKPVYKGCLFEAVFIKLHLNQDAGATGAVAPAAPALGGKEQVKPHSVLANMPVHQQDLLAHLALLKKALKDQPATFKDSETANLMKLESCSDIVAAATEVKESQLYATMVELYEHICNNKESIKHPVLMCFYTRQHVEDHLRGFADAIDEHHICGMMLTILHSPTKAEFSKTLPMLRDAWMRRNGSKRLFTMLVNCILFRHPLNGFESAAQLADMINYRSCRIVRLMKPMQLEGADVFAIVSHGVAEGTVPRILEHYLATQDSDVSAFLTNLLGVMKETLEKLKSFEKEDFEIYLAPADRLYLDSRPYQPNLNQSDKKKSTNLTKQQLDIMRFNDQCATRSEIAALVKKVNIVAYAISKALVQKRDYLTLVLRDLLDVCKDGFRINILRASFVLLMEVLCPLCFVGVLSKAAPRVLDTLKAIFARRADLVNYDEVSALLEQVNSSDDLNLAISFPISDITTYVMSDATAPTSVKETALNTTLKFLKASIAIDQRSLLHVVSANLQNEALHPVITATLNEAVRYLVDVEGITEICKMGLSSNVELVKSAVDLYVANHSTESLATIAEYLRLLGINVPNLQCQVKRVIDIVPKYIDVNPEIVNLASGVFLNYTPDDIMASFLASFKEADNHGRDALFRVMTCYFDKVRGDVCHADVFGSLISASGDSSHLGQTLACFRALSKTVTPDSRNELITHVKTRIESNFPQGIGNLAFERLAPSEAVALGVSSIFIGHLQEKTQYNADVKWNLELLLGLLSSDNDFSKVEAGSHSAAIIAHLARKCALEGEEELINGHIATLLPASFATSSAILPCVSLLKGGGLSYLKKHDVIPKLKDALAVKGGHRKLLFAKELAGQFDRLFEPYVKDIFPNLLQCFPDNFEVCLDACLQIFKILTPVGLRSILPVLTESLCGYISGIKLGCLLILSHVIRDTKLHGVIIKNVCEVVKAVSPCTTDTQRPVKEAADGVLDSIVGLAGEASILYPTMGSILKVLSHPSDVNITSTMQVLADYSREHPNSEGCSDCPIGIVELGLLEPILSRALKSRNGGCRQSAIGFASWLVYRCGSYREVELFFTTLMPNLTDLLKDSLPDVRREAARAIGSCANSFKKFGCDTSKALMVDLINSLMKCLMESVTSLERCSAAAGLAEALWAVDDAFINGIVAKLLLILEARESTPQMREGCLALFNNLPLTCHHYMLAHLDKILSRVMAIMCDEDERVRQMSCNVIRTVIERYNESGGEVLLTHLKSASHSRDWQSRNLVLPLMQSLNAFKEDPRVTVELYLARYDQNTTVKTTAMAIWKGVNVTRSLRQIFPLVLQQVIEMLEQDDDDDLRAQAGECITDAIVRLGSDAVNDFIEAILSCDGAFRGRCIGITSLASNGKAGIEKHLSRILDFLKDCLCKPASCHEASAALATLAAYFPTVVSDVLPSLLNDLFTSAEKDAYLVGIALLIESHSECFATVVREALKPDLDVTRLALLERVLCAKRTKVVFSQQNVLTRCIGSLLLYNSAFPSETMASFSSFVALVKAESVMRLIQVLIEILNDKASGSNEDDKKSSLIRFIACVVELRESEVDTHYGTVGEALARYIFTDPGTLDASLVVLDQLIKSAERRTELENLIAAFARYFRSLDIAKASLPRESLTKTLPLMMSLVQKGLVKTNAKVEAAKCVTAMHQLVGVEQMGPFILKTIGAIIRCLNDKCPSILKIALLEAIYALLHCETAHVRVILYQLQSALFKCLTDVNSDVNLLIAPNLRLYVKLAPNKADSVMSDLFQLASDKVGKPTVKTAALQAVIEVLKARPTLSVAPFDHLLRLLQDSTGGDKQLVCQALGLAAQLDCDFGSAWLQGLFFIVHEDPSAISALAAIVSSDRGFTTLYNGAPKDFVDVLRQSLRSDVPSLSLGALEVFCRVSKLTRSSPLARDFLKAYINILPAGSKFPPGGQSQVLQIYKRLLRFEKRISNFGSQLLYISEAIYSIPLVKLEAEKVLLVLLGQPRDTINLLSFVKQHSTSEKVEKLLSEYATRVLIKANKADQLSDSE